MDKYDAASPGGGVPRAIPRGTGAAAARGEGSALPTFAPAAQGQSRSPCRCPPPPSLPRNAVRRPPAKGVRVPVARAPNDPNFENRSFSVVRDERAW